MVNEKDRPAAVLRSDTPTKNHWVRLVLQGTKSNRDAIGTRVEVDTGKTIKDDRDGKQKEWKIFRQRKGGVGLESANDPRLLIGVGDATELKKIIIRWPSGIVTTLEKVKVGLLALVVHLVIVAVRALGISLLGVGLHVTGPVSAISIAVLYRELFLNPYSPTWARPHAPDDKYGVP